jgi:hypothetical protein
MEIKCIQFFKFIIQWLSQSLCEVGNLFLLLDHTKYSGHLDENWYGQQLTHHPKGDEIDQAVIIQQSYQKTSKNQKGHSREAISPILGSLHKVTSIAELPGQLPG